MAADEYTAASVLIIDDARENRILLGAQLRSSNYRILEAATGEAGIDLAVNEQPDLILLDLMLPYVSGFEVCRTLKNDPRTAYIPIVIITALRDVSYRIKGIEAGADEFISRPHHREELLVRVKSLLQLRRARARLESERNHLRLLYNVAQVTMSYLELEPMIANIIEFTQQAVGATKGSVILTDGEGRVTHKYLARALSGISVGDSIASRVMQDGFAGWLWREQAGDIVADTAVDTRWVSLPDDEEPAGSAVGAPLRQSGENRVLGLIILTHPEPHYFTSSHLAVLETIASQITSALRNARLFAQVREEQRKLSAILSQSNDAIITTDEEQRIALFNRTAEEIFKVTAAEVNGKRLSRVPGLDSLIDLFDQADEGPIGRDIVLHEKSILYASVSPVRGAGYIAVLQDVTERIRMERREKEELRELFGRYVSPSLLEHVMPANRSLVERRKRRAVILFADLRNYTQMIVNLPADVALELLNEIFNELMEVIYEHEGTILDLIGDELEVGFNVPLDQPDAALRALKTAVDMQRRFDELLPGWFARSGAQLGLGIGIDQGEVVIGNVGSYRRMNLALIGEAVNRAHRLVDLAEDGQVVISAELYEIVREEIAEAGVEFDSMGHLTLKGIREKREIFRSQFPRQKLTREQPLSDCSNAAHD